MSNDDLFKIPKIPNGKKKSNRKSKKNKLLADLDPNYIDDKKSVKNGLNSTSSGRGRKRFVPIALKTCSICGQEFADHAGNVLVINFRKKNTICINEKIICIYR